MLTQSGQPRPTSVKGETQTGRLTYENTEAYLDVDGINIHYHEAGTEHEETVVFMHGGGLGASGWFNFFLNIEPFSEHFHTILIDMPNFGRSDAVVIDAEAGCRYDADLLARFLQLKGIQSASLMGNSKGGGAAIAFSVFHNDMLRLNVLMGSSTGPSIFDVMPPQGSALVWEIFNDPTREKVEKLVHLFVYDDSFVDDDYVEFRWQGILDAERRGFRAAVLASWKNHRPENYTLEITKVANPTLVLYGAHDRFAALDSSVSLMRHYPNSELHVFRNCGHWVQFELADEFNELVIRWMQANLGKQ